MKLSGQIPEGSGLKWELRYSMAFVLQGPCHRFSHKEHISMKHKMHLPTVELVLAAALFIAVWLGVQATRQASAAGLG